MTLMQILLVVVATIVGFLVLLLLLLRFALPWWLSRKIAAMADLPQTGIAARISLVPNVLSWQQPGTDGLVDRMLALGFEEVGRFSVPEMPTMQLWAGIHPQEGIAAAIYDHGKVPVFFDLMRVYDDYAVCTVSTNPIHDPENVPPGSACIADPAMAPEMALTTLREQPLTGSAMVVDRQNFAPVFIELYARSIDHILSKTMPDAEKMQRVGERMSEVTGSPAPRLDDAQMQMAVEMQRSSRLSALQEAIIDRFLQSEQIDAREWERIRDRVVVVHDLLSCEEAADLARMAADWEATEPVVASVMVQSLSPIDTFEHISVLLPETQKLRLVGEVDHPLYAQILVAGF